MISKRTPYQSYSRKSGEEKAGSSFMIDDILGSKKTRPISLPDNSRKLKDRYPPISGDLQDNYSSPNRLSPSAFFYNQDHNVFTFPPNDLMNPVDTNIYSIRNGQVLRSPVFHPANHLNSPTPLQKLLSMTVHQDLLSHYPAVILNVQMTGLLSGNMCYTEILPREKEARSAFTSEQTGKLEKLSLTRSICRQQKERG
ncbi:hematopoietically-expressed homeobox protein HHEX [Caerostris extrusa]|uniref:Hematopoietically-expressed homeobox protein HHEX n=1 Tax=Caerostris extrusa TaxID=172846 RepID=A0AAV4NX50_CAEEX|nr:hematopoietically-expressed homeobox protein HHEX [Caerostris extrusa]